MECLNDRKPMTKSSLIDRMKKRDAPKAWIKEVRQLLVILKAMTELNDHYLEIIDILARKVETLEQERK